MVYSLLWYCHLDYSSQSDVWIDDRQTRHSSTTVQEITSIKSMSIYDILIVFELLLYCSILSQSSLLYSCCLAEGWLRCYRGLRPWHTRVASRGYVRNRSLYSLRLSCRDVLLYGVFKIELSKVWLWRPLIVEDLRSATTIRKPVNYFRS